MRAHYKKAMYFSTYTGDEKTHRVCAWEDTERCFVERFRNGYHCADECIFDIFHLYEINFFYAVLQRNVRMVCIFSHTSLVIDAIL